MKRALMFLNGDFDARALNHFEHGINDLVIGVDNGATHAKACSLNLDAIIGDFDSLSDEVRAHYSGKSTDIVEYAAEKDFTDFELALEYVCRKGVQTVELFAALGGRIDHTLANISVIASNKFSEVRITVRDRGLVGRLIRPGETVKFSAAIASEFSLLPLALATSGVVIEGAKWNLKDAELPFGSATGISNVTVDPEFSVGCRQGFLFVVIFDQAAKESSFKRAL